MTFVFNPTGGDLISDQTPLSINTNRRPNSGGTLLIDAYRGKSGGTLTGGTSFGLFQLSQGSRSAFPLEVILPQGQSLGVTLTANISSGSANLYAGFSLYKKDSAE